MYVPVYELMYTVEESGHLVSGVANVATKAILYLLAFHDFLSSTAM